MEQLLPWMPSTAKSLGVSNIYNAREKEEAVALRK